MANSHYLHQTKALKRFDQKNDGYKRAYRREPPLKKAGDRHYGTLRVPEGEKWNVPGNTLKDYAYAMGSYYVERMFGRGHAVGDYGLLKWIDDEKEVTEINRMSPGYRYEVKDPSAMSMDVKKAAKKLGATDVGISELNPLWVYSHAYNPITHEHYPLEIDFNEYKYAIVFLVEMDYEMQQTSPSHIMGATVAYGYSKIVYLAGQMAHFIRGMGYKAIPSGNDTALNIPLAVDAGLGELGRNGLLISRNWGPRVRIGKILTNLPLSPDLPISLGIERFCNVCKICAEECPGQAISSDGLSDKPVNISTNPGVFKWPIDAEKCFGYWGRSMVGCGNCIRTCPFNKPKSKLHEFGRYVVRKFPLFDREMVWIDKLLGYSKRTDPRKFWAN